MSRRTAVSSRFLKLRHVVLPFRFCFTVFFMTQATRRCTSVTPVSHISVPLNVFGLFVSIPVTSTNDGLLFYGKQVGALSYSSVRGALFSLTTMLKLRSPRRITFSKLVKAESRAFTAFSVHDFGD